MVQWLKDLALLQLWVRMQLWLDSVPVLGTCLGVAENEKKSVGFEIRFAFSPAFSA